MKKIVSSVTMLFCSTVPALTLITDPDMPKKNAALMR